MKNLIFNIIVILLFLNGTVRSQNGWINQSSGISENLYCIFFLNENLGWAAGDNGKIITTVNGGISWNVQTSNSNLPIYSIIFKDIFTGWAVGGAGNQNPLCQDQVVNLRTTNGGINWLAVDNGYSLNHFNKLTELSLASNNDLYFCSNGTGQTCMETSGKIAKSTNLGGIWTTLNIYNLPIAYYSVFFLNSNTGWAAGRYATDVPPQIRVISKTTDSGNNWQAVIVDSSFKGGIDFPKTIRFINENTGFIIYGSLKKTTDGGNSWDHTDSIATYGINYFQFVNSDTGWCISYPNGIIRTNNGGSNWISQQSNTGNALSKIFFLNAQTGWIAGDNGTILKTITGGLTSVSNPVYGLPTEFFLSQNYPNPFNPATIIRYSIPSDVRSQTSNVKLTVYNSLGSEVSTLVNEKQTSGNYEVEFNGENLPSGIYFYKLETGSFSEVKRMILLK